MLKPSYYMVVLGTLLASSPAYAYLDPGTGSILIQALLASIAVASAGVATFWAQIRAFFSRFSRRKSADRSTDRADDDDTSHS